MTWTESRSLSCVRARARSRARARCSADGRRGFQAWGLQATRREVQDGSYLLAGKSVKHLYDLVNRKSVFQVLEDGSDRYARPAEYPCATDLSGHAFHSRAP